MTNVLNTVRRAVSNLVSRRAGFLKHRADVLARHAAEGAAEAQALEADRLAYEAWREPQLRYERRQAEAFAAGCRRDRERAEVDLPCRTHPAPAQIELERFVARVQREINEPVRLVEKINPLTDERTVTSDDGGARTRTGDVLVRARREIRDELPFLPDEEVLRRVAALKLEILAALDGVPVDELAAEA